MRRMFSVKVCLSALALFLVSDQLWSQCSTWPTSIPDQCVNNASFQLTGGSPSPGVYFGVGVSGTGPYMFSPSAAGVGSHLVGYRATSCTDTAFKTIVVNSLPNVNMSTLGPFCENRDTVGLNHGSPTSGGTGVYYGPGVTGPPYVFDPVVGPGGSPYTIGYAFTSITTGCSDSAEVQVGVTSVTPATLSGLDTAYCVNQNPQVITPTVAPPLGTLTGPGVSGSTFNIGLAGVGNHTIKYFFTNTNNCTDTAKANVHVRTPPTASLLIPNAIKFSCALDQPFQVTGGMPGGGYYVGNGVDSTTGLYTPDTTLIGWNVVTYKYNDGVCIGTAVDSIQINENPEVTMFPFPKPCANDNFFILNQTYAQPYSSTTSTYGGNGVSGTPGNWVFDPATAGAGTHEITYCFTAPNGCETCITQNLIVNPVPSITFNDITGTCENDPPIDLQQYGQPIGGYFTGPGVDDDSLTWRPATLSGAGTYQLTYTYTDTNGCTATEQNPIATFPKPNVVMSTSRPAHFYPDVSDSTVAQVNICFGDSAFPNSTPSNIIYLPYVNADPGPPEALFPDMDFEYMGVATSTNLCRDTGILKIHVIPPAEAIISGDSSICMGDSTELVASGATAYEWQLTPPVAAASIVVKPKVKTLYQVIARSEQDGDGKDCSSDTTKVHVVVNLLPLVTTALDTNIFLGDDIVLKAYGADTYVWTEKYSGELSCLECPTPVATPEFGSDREDYRAYYVVGTDSNDCSSIDSITVNIDPKVIVFVPSAFSPNGDGINDVLYVKSKGIEEIQFEIYNRFGETVFTSSNLEDGWDGRIEGDYGKKAVYLYKLVATPYKKSLPIEQAGQITLIR